MEVGNILDVCCGGKQFYFDKNDKRVVFMDIRELDTVLCNGQHYEVKPDLLGDFTDIPFEKNSFRMVVFDPPHIIRKKESEKSWVEQKYGCLTGDWKATIKAAFQECFRVLSPRGFPVFKWNEADVPVNTILSLTDAKPIFGHRSGKRSNTHWIVFQKEAEE